MNLENWEPQSELFKRLMQRHIDKARDEAARAALEAGRKEGREQGRDAGRAAGERRAIRLVLESRGLAIDPDDDARLEACSDFATLERWLTRAAPATRADEVVGV
jgi:hypothetical protein